MQRPAKPFTPVRFRIQRPIVMKICIIGFGFVGRALKNGLRENVDCIEIDPKLGTNLNDLKSYEPRIVLNKFDHFIVDEGQWHQIINPFEEECHIIEIQYGASVIEDDIARLSYYNDKKS